MHRVPAKRRGFRLVIPVRICMWRHWTVLRGE